MTVATAPLRKPPFHGWRGATEKRPFPSLGWDILDWTYAKLPSPSDEALPLTFTPEQARRIIRWYELDPDTGQFVWRRGRAEEAKGWGKSPWAAALALAEFRGPVCFDRWDSNGEPVGVPWGTGERPWPWVQIAAVSEDQTANTYSVLYAMLIANGHRAAIELGIDDGRTRLLLKSHETAVLEPVTASAPSREGGRLTFGVLDETHLWNSRNGGTKLARTLMRNAAKTGGRTFETCNAPMLGDKSVAEESTDGVAGVLHYARRPVVEPSPDWPTEKLRAALTEVYLDAPWVNPERILAEVRDPATPWDDALRYYFNIRTAGVARAIDPRLWDERAKVREVPPGTVIGMGFDGSISIDATVLRGCTRDGHSFLLGAWVRPPRVADWEVPRNEVHEVIERAFATYQVGRFYADPPKWVTEIQNWTRQYGKDANGDDIVQELWTSRDRQMAPAVDRWRTALAEGTHSHDGDPITTAHVKAARLRKVRLADAEDDGRTLYTLIKGEDRRQIDGAVADVLAFEAAMAMNEPVPEPEPFVLGGARW